MQQALLIALGGALGSVARYGLSTYIAHASRGDFPWGTLIVNLGGSFLIGVFVEFFDTALIPSEWRSFITIGFLGGYTTFSTFALETVNLIRDGELPLATLNVAATNVLGVLVVALGLYSSRFVIMLFSHR